MKNGRVSLVGAGCGDPELLTLKAQKRLRDCEVLIYDSLVSEQIVNQAPADCEKIYVGKRYGRHAMAQEEINGLLVRKAREGKAVVRLKGGDPYVFGRGSEEFLALMAEGIACEEIPGITSCIAVPAAAGIPVTHRGLSRSFTVITGSAATAEGQEGLEMDFERLAGLEGTLIILMGMHHLAEIAEGLMQAGKPAETPCAVITEGTTAGQRCVRAPLFAIAARAEEEGLASPGVIVIGAVAEFALTAKEEGELSGITVGVTGTVHFTEKISGLLREKGAVVKQMSFLEVQESLQELPDLSAFGWLVFTSPNGVHIFLEKMKRERYDLRRLANPVAVIGRGTAEALEEAGIYADYMPCSYDAEHLAEGLAERLLGEKARENGPAAKPTLFLRARRGSEALPRIFEEKGLPFAEFPLYEIGVNEEKQRQAMEQEADYLVFGAGSSVRAYFDALERHEAEAPEAQGADRKAPKQEASPRKAPRYVCMGEACAGELARFTGEDFLVAKESSAAGIAACICRDVQE